MESETIHHLPASDTYDDNFQEFVKEGKLSRLPSGFIETEKKYIIDLLKDYSFIIGCGLSPAYMNKIGKNLDIFIPYGSDLMFQPFFSKKKLYSKKFLKILYQTYHQRNGIKKAKSVILPVTNPIIEECMIKLNYKGNRVISHIPFIYSRQYKNKTFNDFIFNSDNDVLVHYLRLRKKSDFIIFHHLRHGWTDLNSHDYKGNDKVILGFKKFVQSDVAKNPILILFEHGIDKGQSKLLISKLGLKKNVQWYSVQDRKNIMLMINLCDVGVGEVGHMSSITYGSLCEFMCLAKPIIGNLDVEYNKKNNQEIYPIYNVDNSQDVYQAMHEIFLDYEQAKISGEKNQIWFEKYVISDGLKNIISTIELQN
tara:strand:+ start:455 stop:1555 length:1101 start_codon:yes stop_codon:yes gene_type:complete